MAGTLKRASQTVSPQVPGPLSVQKKGGRSTAFQPHPSFNHPQLSLRLVPLELGLEKRSPYESKYSKTGELIQPYNFTEEETEAQKREVAC